MKISYRDQNSIFNGSMNIFMGSETYDKKNYKMKRRQSEAK